MELRSANERVAVSRVEVDGGGGGELVEDVYRGVLQFCEEVLLVVLDLQLQDVLALLQTRVVLWN